MEHIGTTSFSPHDAGHVDVCSSSSSKGEGSPAYANDKLQALCKEGHLDKALKLLAHVGVPLSDSSYVSVLQLCSKNKSLHRAKQVHAHLVRTNTQLTNFLGDYLVMSLAKCGSFEDACEVSATLSNLTVFAWTAMISASADCGHGQKAINIYQSMREKGVEPNAYTFVSLFKACGVTRNLEQGKQLHELAFGKGFTLDRHVRSALVRMYGKCGAIKEAEGVFTWSFHSDVVSWNAMLSAYIEKGQAEKALHAYRQMLEDNVNPDELTLVSALQACGALAEEQGGSGVVEKGLKITVLLQIGRALHSYVRRGPPNIVVYNTLVSMYGKCGAVAEAGHVFGSLSQRTVVSWNSMLAAYLHGGQCDKVLLLYHRMHYEGLDPGQRTLLRAIQACACMAEKEESYLVEGQPVKVKSLEIGQELQLEAHKHKLGDDTIVSTSLLSMFGKCGAVREAEDVFVALSQHDEVSCNAMLSVYMEHSQGEKTLKLYRQMLEEGYWLGKVGIVLALQACGVLVEQERMLIEGVACDSILLDTVESLHALARRKGLSSDVEVGSALVCVYGKLGPVRKAENVFISLPQRDVVLWSVMLSAYIEQGQGTMALQLYQKMLREGVRIDQHALVFALQACAAIVEKELATTELRSSLWALELGELLHAEAQNKNFTSNTYVANALVSLYGKCGAIVQAENAFNGVSARNILSWNAMLLAYVELGDGEKAFWLFRQMKYQRLLLNDVTLVWISQACRLAGSLEICNELQFLIASAGYDQAILVATSLIHAYGNCASMINAQALFDQALEADLVLWNTCCDGYAAAGDFLCSLCATENLKLAGFTPDDITFLSGLSACGHTGLITEALEYFESMSRDYSICPILKLYGNVIDFLARAGDFKGVEMVLKRMPVEPNLAIWLSLLGACSTHGNIKMGRQAFDQAVRLHPWQTCAYIIMSNIYMDAGLHERVAEVDCLRQKHGGCELFPESGCR